MTPRDRYLEAMLFKALTAQGGAKYAAERALVAAQALVKR